MKFSRGTHLFCKLAAAICAAAGIFVGFSAYAADGGGAAAPAVQAVYGIHQNGIGWTENTEDNTCLKAFADSYVTCFRASVGGQPAGMTGTLAYQVNLSGSGWLSWEENLSQAGTTDSVMPLEAVRMKLTGELAALYDVYYSVLQNGTWSELVTNGETAGEEGKGLRIDGVRVALTAKGAMPGDPKFMAAGRILDPKKPMVALTFDDGPSAETMRILDCLEENGGRATFFMVGNRIGSYPNTVKRMVDMGCEPASHTWEHRDITRLSEAVLLADLTRVDNALEAAAGTRTKLMRPPGGALNSAAGAALAKQGVPAVLWSLDTKDWKTRNAKKTIDAVLSRVRDGDIVLMHDLYESTADAAVVLIPELTRRGYQLVTVSELAGYRGGLVPGLSYSQFRP
ncbi:MAG: polysaccharide deacetylase family protein [Lachnospiraceae bacterium]|nr:polysaccharide deacetylase family protein [Lachnospiraceae bacterium]